MVGGHGTLRVRSRYITVVKISIFSTYGIATYILKGVLCKLYVPAHGSNIYGCSRNRYTRPPARSLELLINNVSPWARPLLHLSILGWHHVLCTSDCDSSKMCDNQLIPTLIGHCSDDWESNCVDGDRERWIEVGGKIGSRRAGYWQYCRRPFETTPREGCNRIFLGVAGGGQFRHGMDS